MLNPLTKSSWLGLLAFFFAAALPCAPASAQQQPNIVIIWGDDIGQSNISAYSRGLMGYKTPNIDRIATEGVMFTDYYAEQSCTAGRASFITGQSGLRTGISCSYTSVVGHLIQSFGAMCSSSHRTNRLTWCAVTLLTHHWLEGHFRIS
jgi:hypothetical protein